VTSKKFEHLNYIAEEPVHVRENEHGRFYFYADGFAYPSVTTVLGHTLSDGLVEWQERVGLERANAIKNQAAHRGTALHGVCEDYLNNKSVTPLKTLPIAYKMFRQIQPFLNRIDNIRCLETPLRSTGRLRVAGRVDCIAEFDGKVSVIDFKSATKPKQEDWIENYFLQAACYSYMYSLERIEKIVIIIGVENGDSQIFIRDPSVYLVPLLRKIEAYYETQESYVSSLAEPAAISA
jgi:hypothetical protein